MADVQIACPNDLLALLFQLLQPRLHGYVPHHPLAQPDQALACVGHIAAHNKAGWELEGDDTAFGHVRDRVGGQTGCDIDGRNLGEDGDSCVALLLFFETPPRKRVHLGVDQVQERLVDFVLLDANEVGVLGVDVCFESLREAIPKKKGYRRAIS